jgi:tol-pal system protein YbgF
MMMPAPLKSKLAHAATAALAVAAGLAMLAPALGQQPAVSDEPATSPSRLESFERDAGGFVGRLFGGSDRFRDSRATAQAQVRGQAQVQLQVAQDAPGDVIGRMDRLESMIRQLTGQVEQLQYRNQQLEQQLRRMQSDGGSAPGQIRPQAAPAAPVPAPGGAAQPAAPGAVPPAAPGGRRSDAFDPAQNPSAPGAPRTLGAVPSGGGPVGGQVGEQVAGLPPPASDESYDPRGIGAPGGRAAGAPLDLSTMSGAAAEGYPAPGAPAAGSLPPPPPRNPNATGAPQVAMAPSALPRDEYDLAYGYVLRKDYPLAEQSFRTFVKKHPGDRLIPDANYWLGETLFQQQRYRDAAEAFLAVSTKFETAAKAPDAMLRLGQSLAALGERDASCATFGELGRKYPRASVNVKQAVERERKRANC